MMDGYSISISPSDALGPVLVTRLHNGTERALELTGTSAESVAVAILTDQGVRRGAVFLAQRFAKAMLAEFDARRECSIVLGAAAVREWLVEWTDVVAAGGGRAC